MQLTYTYWKDHNFYVGYMDDYPQYKTQGEDLQDLEKGLQEIYGWIADGTLEAKEHKGVLQVTG